MLFFSSWIAICSYLVDELSEVAISREERGDGDADESVLI